jgi:hypothetical protein
VLWFGGTLAAAAVSIAVLVFGILYFVGISGISTDAIRDEAEAAASSALGVPVRASLGPARISFEGTQLVGIEVRNVRFSQAGSSSDIVTAGSVRFGLRILPLLTGKIELGNARISDARITTAAASSGKGDWLASVRNEDGLVDPDRLVVKVFGSIHRALDAFAVGSTRKVALAHVDVILPPGNPLGAISIESAEMARPAAGSMKFAARARVAGRAITIEGSAKRDNVARRLETVEVAIAAPGAQSNGEKAAGQSSFGALDLKLSGAEGADGEASRLTITGKLGDSILGIPPDEALSGSVAITASLVTGTNKVEIDHGTLAIGHSRVDFHGAVGPKPREDGSNDVPVYRYEMVSDGSTIMPADSTEPALQIFARVAGAFDPAANSLELDELGVRTMGGELLGTARFDFAAGKAPGIVMALSVPKMPVAHLKQLWPWIAAGGARKWAMNNLFGGVVSDSSLNYRVPVGRLGNGVPLSHDEVYGHFEVSGSRFDVTGAIPPMRDAVGTIDFQGNDVDIALASGTVYLPSGRTVAASNGKLTIRDANMPRVIGDLDMDIAGDADAVTDLASYEPIDAMRHIGMSADEFSGKVSGHVTADVPLHGVEPGERLGWHVALDYEDLDIAKPFDGQLATDAVGTIDVDPTRAVIKARAKLNGAPAEIDMVEPIGGSDVERKREIAIVLDDKARDELAPGLSAMLDGPVKVRFDSAYGGADRMIDVDLSGARLDIPWAGWSKGPGIAAKASFRLRTSGSTTTLSDFNLSGETFKVVGDVVLSSGDLSSATFTTFKLNRCDDVQVSIKRSGKGYTVDVKGESLDARSMIKLYTSDAESVASTSGSTNVSLKARVGSIGGFGGEKLSGVTLSYSGNGSRVGNLDVEAGSARGGRVVIHSATKGDRRTMEMQSNDAGAIVRFLDIYEHMQGGVIKLSLAGPAEGAMTGQVDATDFWVVNEPKLASLVSNTPPGDQRSLNEAVRADIDTSRVRFARGFSTIRKAPGSLQLERGVLRGPLIGLIFQGTLYDKASNMDMTGTFMPAYGLNRIFGEIPLVGLILGNGNDRGLIGVTFRLTGDANKPNLQINPLSVIAPGIFRSIFEFRK